MKKMYPPNPVEFPAFFPEWTYDGFIDALYSWDPHLTRRQPHGRQQARMAG